MSGLMQSIANELLMKRGRKETIRKLKVDADLLLELHLGMACDSGPAVRRRWPQIFARKVVGMRPAMRSEYMAT
jgi:hypothetical protein